MLKLVEVEESRKRISSFIKHTPLIYSSYSSLVSNDEVYLKTENLQYTNSFKIRGARNFIL